MVDEQGSSELEEWCLRPSLEAIGYWQRPALRSSMTTRLPVAAALPQQIRSNRALAFFTTENQRRTLAPVMRALGTAPADLIGTKVRLSPRAGAAALLGPVRRSRFSSAVSEVARSRQPGIGAEAWRIVQARYRLADLAASDLLRGDEGCVIVSTARDPRIRRILRRAAEVGLPTVYIAHAPLTRKGSYQDLPVTAAGLRGPAEVAHYARLGARPGTLFAIGNPAVNLLSGATSRAASGPSIVAVSPDPPDVLQRIFDLCAESLPGEVVLAPHPRSNRPQLAAMMPPHWKLSDVPTIELLRRGAARVIQFSSGIAWEAAALGIPVLQLLVDEAPGDYYFLDPDPRIGRASTAAQVAEWAARTTQSETPTTEDMRNFAREWCAYDDVESIDLTVEMVDHATTMSPMVLSLDGWAAGGPARALARAPEITY